MDRTEKTSEDIQQSDPSEAKTEESVQDFDNGKIEPFDDESADHESNGLDNSGPDSEPIPTTKNPAENADQTLVQEQPLESNQETGDGSEGQNAELAPDDHEKDATDSSNQTNETATVANAADSIATDPVPEKTDIPDQAPEDATASPAEASGDEKADEIDIAEAPEEQVSVDDLNDPNQEESDVKHESAPEADVENTELKAEATDTSSVEEAVSATSEAVDQEADKTDEAQGSSAEETESDHPIEPLPSENTDDAPADPAKDDEEHQTGTNEKENDPDSAENIPETDDTIKAPTETADEPAMLDTEGEDVAAEQEAAQDEGGDPKTKTESSDENVEEETAATAPENQSATDDETLEDDAEENDLQTPDARTSLVKIAVSAVLIIALFSGFFIFDNKSKPKTSPKDAQQMQTIHPQPAKVERKEIREIQSLVTPSIYDDSINEISTLRDTLLKKKAEILALKKRYQQSIEEQEKEILDAQHNTDIQTFLEATAHHRIVFSLKTIQRRQAYIGQLERPLAWVSGACEDLLFIKRRVMMDLQLSAVASGIDMDQHVQEMHRALQKYRPTADKLAIDPTDARLESIETIWEQIQNKQDKVSPQPVYSKNQIISAEICAGDFSRIGELSVISAATAECITEMQGSDLFLNQISEISPGAARQLCQWKGSWICMNGIKALSPRVAHYLFQWDGNWISLNGLTEFPAEIAETLLHWHGGQLELMGLQDTPDAHAQIGIEYLAQWERSGGKLFVPKQLREKIDALHRRYG